MGRSILVSILSIWVIGCQGDRDERHDTSSSYPQLNNHLYECQSTQAQLSLLWEYLDEWYLWRELLPQKSDFTQEESLGSAMGLVRSVSALDRWSNVITESEYYEYFVNEYRAQFGFKIGLSQDGKQLVVFDVYENSDASRVGLTRGDKIVALNGSLISALTQRDIERLVSSGNFSDSKGLEVQWIDRDSNYHTAYIERKNFEYNRVRYTTQYEVGAKHVGYLVLDVFDEPSSEEINNAINFFADSSIDQLILDLRYNPGGFGHVANQLATQIAGENVRGETFNTLEFNAQKAQEIQSSILFTLTEGQNSLHLTDLIVLTTNRTASSSELLINALDPHINVRTIGETTAGKPVGMKVVGLCENLIFAVTQKNVNAAGYGDFYEGIDADCVVEDVPDYSWGDVRDPILQEALYMSEFGTCKP